MINFTMIITNNFTKKVYSYYYDFTVIIITTYNVTVIKPHYYIISNYFF